MAKSIPTGTRDVLPDEMRELRAIEASLAELFEREGYGEVQTPVLEYQEESPTGAGRSAAARYRFYDETGASLALRSDMTEPIARLVSNRFADHEGALRLRYSGRIYRPVRMQGAELRELHQVGIELIGAEAPAGTIEVIRLLIAALDAIGLQRAVVGLGDADLFGQLLDELAVEGAAKQRILACLAAHDLVAIEAEAGDLAEGVEPAARDLQPGVHDNGSCSAPGAKNQRCTLGRSALIESSAAPGWSPAASG